MDNWTQIEWAEEARAYARVKELLDMVEAYNMDDFNDFNPQKLYALAKRVEEENKTQRVGCVLGDNKIYIVPIEDKPIKFVLESSVDN